MARLIYKEKDEEKVYHIEKKVTYIGRQSTCDVPIKGHNASRHHARIINDANDYLVVDTQSRNGTFVNGRKVAQTYLTEDDHIQIGIQKFRFHLDPEDKIPSFQLKRYEIIEKIGRGGMGIVYKAKQKSMDRIVALKILHERFSRDSGFVDRFIKEAQAAGKLSHPNIIHVHDVSKEGGMYYFSMEYVSGLTATSLLMEKGEFTPEEVLDITKQVAKGLDYAHDNNIIHRDIKPDNIMITKESEVKLADLGIARNLKESSNNIEKDTIYGTPLYMAPEQALGLELDATVDIYALGATAYHLITGEPPFQAAKAIEILKMHINEPLISPKEKRPDIPDALSQMIEIMMSKETEDRYQSARDIVEEIEILQRGGSVSYKRTPLRETAILKRLSAGELVEPSVNVVDFPSDDRVKQLVSLDPKKRKTIFLITLFILGLIAIFICTIFLSDIFKQDKGNQGAADTSIDEILDQCTALRNEGKLQDEFNTLYHKVHKKLSPDDPRTHEIDKRLENLSAFLDKENWEELQKEHLQKFSDFLQFAKSNAENIDDVISQGNQCLTEEFIRVFPDRTVQVRNTLKTFEDKIRARLEEEENKVFEAIISQDNTSPEGYKSIKEMAANYLKKYRNVNPAHLKIVKQELEKANVGERQMIEKERENDLQTLQSNLEGAYKDDKYARMYSIYNGVKNRKEIKNTKWEVEAGKVFNKWRTVMQSNLNRSRNQLKSDFSQKKYRNIFKSLDKLDKIYKGTEFEKESSTISGKFKQDIKKEHTKLINLITQERKMFSYNGAKILLIKEIHTFMGTSYQTSLEALSDDLELLKKLWDYVIQHGEKVEIELPIIIINMGEENTLKGVKPQGIYLKLTSNMEIPPNFIIWDKLTDFQIYTIFKSILKESEAKRDYYGYLAVFCKYRNLKEQQKEAMDLKNQR